VCGKELQGRLAAGNLLTMSWFAWFALAVVIMGFAAVTGMKAKGTRHVARTHLMGAARVVLVVIVVAVAYLVFRAYSAG
jgi:hypothetical protein